MITATNGLTLNHGVVRGYRWISLNEDPYGYKKEDPERADNRGRVLLYLIDNTVEFLNITYAPLAELLIAGQNNIVDKGHLTVEISSSDKTETIVFDPEDEDFYAILASHPLIIEKEFAHPNNSTFANVGWKWDGEKFHQ